MAPAKSPAVANPPPPRMPAPPPKPMPAWRRNLARAAPWILAVFAAGGVVQVFLAGYGITDLGGEGLGLHRGFAHLLEMLPILVILAAFLGGDWRTGVGGVVLLALFFLQHMLLEAASPAVRGLHAANGTVMVLLAAILFLRRPRPDAPPVATR